MSLQGWTHRAQLMGTEPQISSLKNIVMHT